jgi:hypothetical protein
MHSYTFKNMLLTYIMLSMILQLGVVAIVITGFAAASVDRSYFAGSTESKFRFCYQ